MDKRECEYAEECELASTDWCPPATGGKSSECGYHRLMPCGHAKVYERIEREDDTITIWCEQCEAAEELRQRMAAAQEFMRDVAEPWRTEVQDAEASPASAA